MWDKLRIRDTTDKDKNFILKSWMKNYKKSLVASQIHPDIFYKNYQDAIENCLATATTMILCDKEDPNFIYAFMVLDELNEANILHFLYVRDDFRNFKLAKQIYNQFLKDKTLFFTHQTRTMSKEGKWLNTSQELADRFGAIYNPFLFWGQYVK